MNDTTGPKTQMSQSRSRGSAMVLVLIVILVGTLGFSILLKRSGEQTEKAASESAKNTAITMATGHLERVKRQFMTDMQTAIGYVNENPNAAANVTAYVIDNHPLLEPVIDLPEGHSFKISPIAQGAAGSNLGYQVFVNNVLPKVFSLTYQARDEKGSVARVTHKFQIGRSTLNNFAIAYHNQPAPVAFGGPLDINGQVALIFNEDATNWQNANNQPLLQLNTVGGPINFNELLMTNVGQFYTNGDSSNPNLAVLAGTEPANFGAGVAYGQGSSLSQGLTNARASLMSAPTVNGVLPGENVAFSRVFIWHDGSQTRYQIEVHPPSQLTLGESMSPVGAIVMPPAQEI